MIRFTKAYSGRETGNFTVQKGCLVDDNFFSAPEQIDYLVNTLKVAEVVETEKVAEVREPESAEPKKRGRPTKKGK